MIDIFALAATLAADRPRKPKVGVSEAEGDEVKVILLNKRRKELLDCLAAEWFAVAHWTETDFSVDSTCSYVLDGDFLVLQK